MPTQTQVLTYDGVRLRCDSLDEKIAINKEEVIARIDDKTTAIHNELAYVHERTYVNEKRLDKLEADLRSVMDAMTEKPKQKWLWEIFEPNDLNIDFPYNL